MHTAVGGWAGGAGRGGRATHPKVGRAWMGRGEPPHGEFFVFQIFDFMENGLETLVTDRAIGGHRFLSAGWLGGGGGGGGEGRWKKNPKSVHPPPT